MAFRPSSFSGSPSSLAPTILRRRARCSNASANASRSSMTRRSSVWSAQLYPRSSFVSAFFFLKLSSFSFLHSHFFFLFLLISSVTRATSTAARTFGVANQRRHGQVVRANVGAFATLIFCRPQCYELTLLRMIVAELSLIVYCIYIHSFVSPSLHTAGDTKLGVLVTLIKPPF